jgi:hypothetical protein
VCCRLRVPEGQQEGAGLAALAWALVGMGVVAVDAAAAAEGEVVGQWAARSGCDWGCV